MLPGSMLLQALAAYRDRENFTVLLTVAVFIAIAFAVRTDTTWVGPRPRGERSDVSIATGGT
jgi:hypothetical protein